MTIYGIFVVDTYAFNVAKKFNFTTSVKLIVVMTFVGVRLVFTKPDASKAPIYVKPTTHKPCLSNHMS